MHPSRAALLAPLLLIVAGCTGAPGEATDVLATFYPLAFVADRLLGEELSGAALVPPGIEPHDWEPSATDIARLDASRVLLTQGAGFEPWLDGLLANLGNGAPRVVVTTSALTLAPRSEQSEGAFDPHTWLAPSLLATQAGTAAEALAIEYPTQAEAILQRDAALRAELLALHADYEEGLAACEARIIIANHDAYGYLAREYDFEVVALSGLSPEAEPDPATIAAAVDVAREHNITIVFFEELVSPRVAEVVANEVGAQTRVLSPIESAPDDGDVLTLMRENLVELREAMRCT